MTSKSSSSSFTVQFLGPQIVFGRRDGETLRVLVEDSGFSSTSMLQVSNLQGILYWLQDKNVCPEIVENVRSFLCGF